MPLIATTAPALSESTAAASASSPSDCNDPVGSRHVRRGPHRGQAFGCAWNRRSAGSSYSAWQEGHIVNPAMVVAGRS